MTLVLFSDSVNFKYMTETWRPKKNQTCNRWTSRGPAIVNVLKTNGTIITVAQVKRCSSNSRCVYSSLQICRQRRCGVFPHIVSTLLCAAAISVQKKARWLRVVKFPQTFVRLRHVFEILLTVISQNSHCHYQSTDSTVIER